MKHYFFSIIMLSFLLPFSLYGQDFDWSLFSIEDYRYLEYQKYEEIDAIQINMTVKYGFSIEEFAANSFKMKWEILDEKGAVRFKSKNADLSGFEHESIRVDYPNRDKKDYMSDDDVEFFIPYKKLDLESGVHDLTLIIYLQQTFKSREYKEINRLPLKINMPEIASYSLSEQQFKVDNTKIKNPQFFRSGKAAAKVSFDLLVDYGANEMEEEGFEFYYILKDKNERFLKNTKKKHDVFIYGKKWEEAELNVEGKYVFQGLFIYVFHDDLNAEGFSDYIIELFARDKKETDIKLHTFNLELEKPKRVQYHEQRMKAGNIQLAWEEETGFSLTCNAELIHPYVIVKSVEGAEYFFHATIKQNNRVVGKSWVNSYAHRNFKWRDDIVLKPDGSNDKGNLQFFIPYYDLNLSEGSQEIQVEIQAFSKDGKIKFPVAGKSNITINQKKYKKAILNISKLTAEYKAYDAKGFGEGKPDMRCVIRVGGNDRQFKKYEGNTYSLYPGRIEIRYYEGDEIEIEIKDLDSFNKNDEMGRYTIPNQEKGKSFSEKNIKFGDIEKMNYSFQEMN